MSAGWRLCNAITDGRSSLPIRRASRTVARSQLARRRASGTASRTLGVRLSEPLVCAVSNADTPALRTDTPATGWDSTAVNENSPRSFEGGPEMTTSAAAERRELAHRTGNGIEVTLLWTESTNGVTIAVADTHSGGELEFDVDGSRALDAFKHPYAYAATVRVRSAQATRLAPAR
jgi:hypothetical protein